jgi:hypothetical protein
VYRREALPSLTCLGCGEAVDISSLKEGDRFECANCAGLTLELVHREGEISLRQVYRVSCPVCGQMLEAPEHARAGDTMTCCERTFRLTYEFGAYALE